jgi:hypothetical protein
MEIAELKELFSSYNIKIPPKAIAVIEQSVQSEKYSIDTVAHWIKTNPEKYRDLFNNRELFKQQINPESIKNISGLHAYAKTLKLDIPESTMTAMETSIKNKEYSPSILANYLQGKAYQQFLQSTKVPYISEADHKQIKDSYGTDGYNRYIKNLSDLSKKTGVTEPVLHSISQEYFRDLPRAMTLLNETLKKLPEINSDRSSIEAYSKACGHPLNEIKIQFLYDINLTKDEMKAHIMRSAIENFSKGPELFRNKIVAIGKEHQNEHTKQQELSI